MEDIELNENDRESISGFRLIEMSILSKVLSLPVCPNCYNTSSLKLTDVADKKRDLPIILKFTVMTMYLFINFTSLL